MKKARKEQKNSVIPSGVHSAADEGAESYAALALPGVLYCALGGISRLEGDSPALARLRRRLEARRAGAGRGLGASETRQLLRRSQDAHRRYDTFRRSI